MPMYFPGVALGAVQQLPTPVQAMTPAAPPLPRVPENVDVQPRLFRAPPDSGDYLYQPRETGVAFRVLMITGAGTLGGLLVTLFALRFLGAIV